MIGILTFLSAISISVVAAFYSIVGLMAIFTGAALEIAVMGGVLEVGKLVTASWLYQNWRNKLVSLALKTYLFIAVIVLIFITSIGIFGFLSKAHLEQVNPTNNNVLLITQLDNQIAFEQKQIDRSQNTLDRLDAALDKYIDMEYVTRGLKERQKQEDEREALNTIIADANKNIIQLNNQKYELEREVLIQEADVGPIKYIAELIYGDDAKDMLDHAVRALIIIFIFVFDPLAVLLLVSANVSLRTSQLAKEEKKQDKVKALERKYRSLQTRHRNKMKKQKSIANRKINETVENVKGVRKVTREQDGVSMTTYE
tara:strand:+ start:3852 stop:4793 length:942 start_codon:yes stop_codon:yes gene_type:complete